ncbi:ABC-type glycerol-3-phosphate transport system, substrate-binding protein [Paenibacillus sp. 1_12]|uniref:extracellular solute-binding protein n=1 Tax=Paenibacillus sp. 1_12 TaxID=1566278 RepID=UPI0008E69648|nr:extracellular solute-binding protein [Paenibacillus sp. 1_12]SFL25465.1 ABC-type glycerol-3-phosphate transport system, substrate-binding protein [Paenibacillus sp. 1_12]
MKLKQWTLWGIAALLIFTVGAFYSMNMNQSSGVNSESDRATAISIWLYSEGLEAYVNEFKQLHPNIDVDVRYFRSSEQLFTELMASISANAAPQLAELHSYYGIPQLVDTKAVIPTEHTRIEGGSQLHPTFTAPFHYEGVDWAVPFGSGLPLIYYRQELLKHPQERSFTSWEQIVQAAQQPQSESSDTVGNAHWGLAMDNELPWFMDNLSFTSEYNGDKNPLFKRSRLESALTSWSDWVHLSGILKPLVHRRAASDFINGKVGIFLSSSEMLPTVERYIGGKFQFDAGRMPILAQQGIVPEIHGMVLLHAAAPKVQAAQSFMAYLLLEQTQASLWRNKGLIPSRSDVLVKLQEEEAWSQRQKMILDSARMLAVKSPSVNDYDQWMSIQALIEQLEQNKDVNLNKKLEEIYGSH